MPETESAGVCRVCHNETGNTEYRVREMLHGTREEHSYLQCAACGCLQLAHVPQDLSVFYPDDYCCHKDYGRRTRNVARRAFDTMRIAASVPREGVAAKIFNAVAPELDYLSWVQYSGADTNSRILDIGCGTGKLLIRMSMGGFRVLHGIDPFIKADIHVGNVRIDKIGTREFIATEPEKYDLVMLQHAFEHVPEPYETLLEAKELMKDDAYLLIRIPVADCYAREHYGENWFSWDAPRHIYLHTQKSMNLLAAKTGFRIQRVQYDATYHQLQKSELYRQGIPGNKHREALRQFTRSQIRDFQQLAEQLNIDQRGEQAAFFLRKNEASGALSKAA